MKKGIKKLFMKSIKSIITLSIISMLILSNIAMLVFSNFFAKKYFSKQIKEDIHVITEQAANMIKNELNVTEKKVETLANLWSITKDWPHEKKAKFYEKLADELGFIEFLFAKPNGDGINLNTAAATFNIGQREYFKKSMQGEIFTSEILVDLVSKEKIIAVSAPCYENGKIVGVFGGMKRVTFISDLCEAFKWKESGIISVFDMNSQVIGHTKKEIVDNDLNIIEKAKTDKNYESISNFFKDKILTSQNGVGEYIFEGNTKIAGFSNVEGREYSVLVSINDSEVNMPLNNLVRWLLTVSIIIIIVFIIISYTTLSSRISLAFNNLKKDIEEIAKYNLTAKPSKDYSKSENEVGDIYRATIKLKQNMIDIINNIKTSTEDLENASNLLNNKSDIANQVALEIANNIEDISKGAVSQAEDTQNGVIEIQNMSNLLKQNQNNLYELRSSSDKAEELKNQGVKTMNELLHSTQKNKDISKDIKIAIDNTKNSVDEIKSAGEMIKSIAEQTNLLALNAAIEAARAGEAGKGFAVVAEEIRKLAENSSSFTEQINSSVTELLSRTNYAVEKISESSEIVEVQSNNVNDVESKFDGIANSINNLRKYLDEMMISNENINKSQESLYAIMENSSALSQQNAASTEQISASTHTQTNSFEEIAKESSKLLELSSKLKDIVYKFTL